MSIEWIALIVMGILGLGSSNLMFNLLVQKNKDKRTIIESVSVIIPPELRKQGYTSDVFVKQIDKQALYIVVRGPETEIENVKMLIKAGLESEVERL